MNETRTLAPSRWKSLGRCGPIAMVGLMVLSVTTLAHNSLTACIQHKARLTVGARHVDVTFELTFFEEWSARERARMDLDGSGRISRAEIESYVKKLAPELGGQIRLLIGGRRLDLVSLYDPEVDLMTSEKVGPDHHRFRLFYFAATPAWLAGGQAVVVEDGLWAQAKALRTLEVEGRDGCVLTAERSSEPWSAPTQPGEPWPFRAKCLKPPVMKPSPAEP